MYLNSVTLTGFIGADAESRKTKNNTDMTVFSVATKNSWKDAETGQWISRTDWHHCVTFGRIAVATASLKKGDHVHVQGQLQTREYDRSYGTSDAHKQRVTEIRVSSVLKVERLTKDDDAQSDEPEESVM